MEASVIVAKCRCGQYYGMRTEKRGGDWVRTWAFPMNQGMIEKEHYLHDQKIQGSLAPVGEYPGCPYCKTNGFYVCHKCGHINCYSGEKRVVCGWCGTEAGIQMKREFEVDTGQM